MLVRITDDRVVYRPVLPLELFEVVLHVHRLVELDDVRCSELRGLGHHTFHNRDACVDSLRGSWRAGLRFLRFYDLVFDSRS